MMDRRTLRAPALSLSLSLMVGALSGCDSTEPLRIPTSQHNVAASDHSAGEAVKIATHGSAHSQEKTPAPKKPIEITFDSIKFDIKKGDPFFRSMLTPQIESLDGQPVRLRGYILPSFQQTGIRQFVLVRDNLECCFGPGAAIYDCVVVDMRPGKSTSYTVRPVTVSGTFAVRELLDPDGKHLAIYHLDGDAVE